MQNDLDNSRIFEPLIAKDENLLWTGSAGRGRLLYPVDMIRLAIGLAFAFLPLYFVAIFFAFPRLPRFAGAGPFLVPEGV